MNSPSTDFYVFNNIDAFHVGDTEPAIDLLEYVGGLDGFGSGVSLVPGRQWVGY